MESAGSTTTTINFGSEMGSGGSTSAAINFRREMGSGTRGWGKIQTCVRGLLKFPFSGDVPSCVCGRFSWGEIDRLSHHDKGGDR